MLNFLSSNIRGIGSSGSIERLILFQEQLHLPLLCLQEPLVDSSKLEKFKKRLRMDHSFFNINNKIWIYWNHEIIVDIIQDKDQHVLIKISHNDGPSIFLSIIYAKCSEDLRRELWADLKTIANTVQGPWGAIRDFNVICTAEEKMGGRPFTLGESLDFLDCLSECGLQDAGYTGAKFTCCNNRDPPNTIWKRLDRLVYNTNWFDDYNTISVSHLSRTCSDHAPLLVNMNNIAPQCIKYFKIFNVWTEHESFLGTIQRCWEELVVENPMYILHQKIKKTCKMLSLWSRETYGDIYEEPKRLEAQMKVLEENSVINNTKANICELFRYRAEFTKYLKLQDAILRQKARAKWLEEGDANTSYFHSTIKDRRRRLSLKKIMNEQNQWLEGNDQIAEGAVSFYQNLFSRESVAIDTETINYLPRCITDEDNKMLTSLNTITRMKRLTGMVYHKFPIKYLGCPLITGKKKISYYNDIVKKVTSKIKGWHSKLLSLGGKAILIRHVLLALPTHLLSVVDPPKGTFEIIEKCLARFFWSDKTLPKQTSPDIMG
ncbi:hypothetical protein H5410_038103 [Solanum commersonii]|uniref:Uncharacterized protein n=1 Tax=Solanum commersonii TaxID=4109 RepID=A0A9J5YAC1_SOLCO|nr:hypothetical protein H5410_038103 [Solanum commersonii]